MKKARSPMRRAFTRNFDMISSILFDKRFLLPALHCLDGSLPAHCSDLIRLLFHKHEFYRPAGVGVTRTPTGVVQGCALDRIGRPSSIVCAICTFEDIAEEGHRCMKGYFLLIGAMRLPNIRSQKPGTAEISGLLASSHEAVIRSCHQRNRPSCA